MSSLPETRDFCKPVGTSIFARFWWDSKYQILRAKRPSPVVRSWRSCRAPWVCRFPFVLGIMYSLQFMRSRIPSLTRCAASSRSNLLMAQRRCAFTFWTYSIHAAFVESYCWWKAYADAWNCAAQRAGPHCAPYLRTQHICCSSTLWAWCFILATTVKFSAVILSPRYSN